MPDRPQLKAEDPLGLGHPLRVLVVDDDDDTRDMFKLLLTSIGWRVVAASSGPEAIGLFDPAAIDFVLTDVGMPEMDGCMMLEQLRARGYTPAVAVTGYGGAETVARLRDAGFDGCLTKPFHLTSLIELLREIASRGSE